MSIKLAVAKLVIRSKRKKEIWKNPVGERFQVVRDGKRPVEVFL